MTKGRQILVLARKSQWQAYKSELGRGEEQENVFITSVGEYRWVDPGADGAMDYIRGSRIDGVVLLCMVPPPLLYQVVFPTMRSSRGY